MQGLLRAPLQITSLNSGAVLTLRGLELGTYPSIIYGYETGETITINPWKVARNFSYYKAPMPKECLLQGKYDCAAASLAVLLGHTLFQVKGVMGAHGWRNDRSGSTDKILRETARAFGHDLVFCGRRSILAMLDKIPPAMITIRSLNYAKGAHGVAWHDGQLIDPNYGSATRKFWGPEWAPWTVDAYSALVVSKRVLSDADHKEIEGIRKHGTDEEICEVIAGIAI